MSAPDASLNDIPAVFTNGGANLLTTALQGQEWSGTDVSEKIVAGLLAHEKLRPITKKNPPAPKDQSGVAAYLETVDEWEHVEFSMTTTEDEREIIRKCLKHESTAKKLGNSYHLSRLYIAFGLDKK